jgi:hypothetical protein
MSKVAFIPKDEDSPLNWSVWKSLFDFSFLITLEEKYCLQNVQQDRENNKNYFSGNFFLP